MDYRRRIEGLRQLMLEAGLDGVLYGLGPNLRYLTGLPVDWRREAEPAEPKALFALPAGGEPTLILEGELGCLAAVAHVAAVVTQTSVETASALRGLLRPGKIGISRPAAAHLAALAAQALDGGATCIDAEDLTVPLRMLKDDAEIAALRRVVALTDTVMERIIRQVRPGLSQRELEALIARTGLELGAEDVSFEPAGKYVKSGSEPSADPFMYPPEAPLLAGSSIAFDFGFVLDGYCSDFGRSFYSGPAPGHIAGAYRALQEAQCHLISQMGPGRLKLNELFDVLEDALDDRGYGDRLRARLPDGSIGHQIGVDLHENPWLRRTTDVPLAAGMVMAIEPKLWLPGEYYLRVEDIVLVTEDGAESLTQFDRKLFELPV